MQITLCTVGIECIIFQIQFSHLQIEGLFSVNKKCKKTQIFYFYLLTYYRKKTEPELSGPAGPTQHMLFFSETAVYMQTEKAAFFYI